METAAFLPTTRTEPLKLPEIWLPIDFYVSCSGTRKRTLHVPHRVVDLWAESKGVKQKAIVLETHLLVHLTVIIDLQLSSNFKLIYGHQASPQGRPSPLQSGQPTDQSKSDRHALDHRNAARHQPNRAGH